MDNFLLGFFKINLLVPSMTRKYCQKHINLNYIPEINSISSQKYMAKHVPMISFSVKFPLGMLLIYYHLRAILLHLYGLLLTFINSYIHCWYLTEFFLMACFIVIVCSNILLHLTLIAACDL